jgi:hypothetical protein
MRTLSHALIAGMIGAVLLSACATSSGPTSLGSDTWRIVAKNGVIGMQKANTHCQSMGKKAVKVSMQETQKADASEVTYRCSKEGDHQEARPSVESAPPPDKIAQ